MLAKLTSKNQLTLPKDIVSAFPGVSYFEVTERSGCIILSPVRLNQGDAVRRELRELGITGKDVQEAIRRARRDERGRRG